MTPYREPGEVKDGYEGADDNDFAYLEERIMDRCFERVKNGQRGPALVRVNTDDFRRMVARLRVTVEERADGALSFVMYTASGKATILMDGDAPPDRYHIEMLNEKRAFDPGDVVRLKSGLTPMTVDGYDDRDKVKCVWFEQGTIARAVLDERVLEKCEAST